MNIESILGLHVRGEFQCALHRRNLHRSVVKALDLAALSIAKEQLVRYATDSLAWPELVF